ncbi:helix-turn-helix domain-containing protein [Variovorax sp. OV329]|uniref:helix-turn-helix domain-containing protein n=1 Tax=Variovorax sp. OV329 TaxID=1882825 RepID=UPI0008E9F302|nr:DNA-binding transcriptional regulator YiaG, contains XRE-type HTH domain [Variovorax sp. OV329]
MELLIAGRMATSGAQCKSMANIATVLKSEISRIARKEVRSEIESLKKANAQHRSAIAHLKRQVSELQGQLKKAGRNAMADARASAKADEGTSRRFSADRLAAHRTKLGLSAASYGKLVGMSGATIYLWEQGKSRPNAEQLQRLAALRSLSRRTVQEQLSST